MTDENFSDALAVRCDIKEFGGKEIGEKAYVEEFNNPSYTHFLLRYKGTACAIACIFEYQHQATLENVAMLKEYRYKV